MPKNLVAWAKIGGASAIMSLVLTGCTMSSLSLSTSASLKPEEAKAKAESFINTNLMQGATATVDSIVEEGGLYKVSVNLGGGQKVDSYITKDGKTFFPQGLAVTDGDNSAQAQDDTNAQPEQTSTPKSDKPVVELFVMSQCPYGTQIEKGIIPVVEKLGDKIDFQLKFCDYAMHGEVELKEQLSQYCIDKNEPKKLLSYLTCFLKAGDSASCLKSAGINASKLASCVKDTDNEFQVTKKFNDKTGYKGSYPPFDVYAADNAKYNVGGSPTLIINGAETQTGRSPADLMATICAGFNSLPDVCKEKLSSDTPAAGFGEGTAAGASSADCGQ